MFALPLWERCHRCCFLHECRDPFPASGECPHPTEAALTDREPPLPPSQPRLLSEYREFLQADAVAASAFERWQHGIIPHDSDYLHLRGMAQQSGDNLVCAPPVWLLYDILSASLQTLATDFYSYYASGPFDESDTIPGALDPKTTFASAIHYLHKLRTHHLRINSINRDQWGRIVLVVFQFAVVATGHFLFDQSRPSDSNWARLVLDFMRHVLYWMIRGKALDLNEKDDDAFRAIFEAEWRQLLNYADHFYGFRVIPKLTPAHMERYQALPHGDEEIRRAISTYLDHQATEASHLIKPYVPQFTDVVFEQRLRRLYEPLRQVLVEKILDDLEVHGKDRQALRPDVKQIMDKEYDRCRREFSFYWQREGQDKPLGKLGFITYPQTAAGQAVLEKLLAEAGLFLTRFNLREVAFANYIEQRLAARTRQTFSLQNRAEQVNRHSQRITDADHGKSDLHQANLEAASDQDGQWEETHHWVTPEITGPNGTHYFTIHQAARYYGCSVDQLRRWDKPDKVPALRIKDVLAPPYEGWKPMTRLYPATEETRQAINLVQARAAKHSTHLENGEVERKTAAKILGVHPNTLLKLERSGLINPIRRGQIVAYDQKTINQAQAQLRNSRRNRAD